MLHQISMGIESSRFRSWVGYTTSIEEWPERSSKEAAMPKEMAFRVPRCFASA
jgi:hypothetical protein